MLQTAFLNMPRVTPNSSPVILKINGLGWNYAGDSFKGDMTCVLIEKSITR
jgi:hypothetical protein